MKEEEDHRPFFRAAGSARVAAAKRGAIQCSAAARRGAFVVGIREIQTQKNGGKFEIGCGAAPEGWEEGAMAFDGGCC